MVLVLLLLAVASAQADPFFVDATREAGLDHPTISGGPHKRFILESTGSGAAFFDCDGDGDLDLYVVNGSTYTNYNAGPGNVLYRNDGGAFVAVAAGVEDRGWGMGVAVGDYDGDGHSDLYVTNYGANALYRNRGDGAFAAVTAQAGVAGDDFSTSAAFFDYDGDGDLDLYVANYVVFDIEPVLQDPALEDPCIYLGGLRVFCGPQGMEGGRDRLYRNDGEAFADVTDASGVATANFHYGLGVVPADFDRDGDLDLFVANDETPNVLFRNDGGRLGDIGLEAGVAYNGDGEPEASMGVDAGDCDGDGDLDLYVTNFYGETNTLYLNSGGGTFIDATSERGLAAPTVGYLGWGTRFFDFDFDGDLDLFVANGHIYPQVDHASAGGTYAQRTSFSPTRGRASSLRWKRPAPDCWCKSRAVRPSAATTTKTAMSICSRPTSTTARRSCAMRRAPATISWCKSTRKSSALGCGWWWAADAGAIGRRGGELLGPQRRAPLLWLGPGRARGARGGAVARWRGDAVGGFAGG